MGDSARELFTKRNEPPVEVLLCARFGSRGHGWI